MLLSGKACSLQNKEIMTATAYGLSRETTIIIFDSLTGQFMRQPLCTAIEAIGL